MRDLALIPVLRRSPGEGKGYQLQDSGLENSQRVRQDWVTFTFTFALRSSWEYIDSPSLTAKNILNLLLVLTNWWCPHVETSLVLLEEVVAMTSAFSWQNFVSLCLHFVFWGQTWLLFQGSLDILLLYSNPLWWKGHFFFGVLEVLVCLPGTIQLELFWH